MKETEVNRMKIAVEVKYPSMLLDAVEDLEKAARDARSAYIRLSQLVKVTPYDNHGVAMERWEETIDTRLEKE